MLRVASLTPSHCAFELERCDVALANALRRIMLSEVPTLAIDWVDVVENDSALHDPVLAHRLGLLPVRANPDLFEACAGRDHVRVGVNAIEFRLDVVATADAVQALDGTVHVTTRSLEVIAGSVKHCGMVHDDIVICKLKPGQRIKLSAFAVKGVGATHTKWSPVCTAAYRMTPSVAVAKKRLSSMANAKEVSLAIRNACPRSVFDIEDDGLLGVADARACSVCRECQRKPEWAEVAVLSRVENSYLFSVESTGSIDCQMIIAKSLQILREKCLVIQEALEVVQRAG